MKPIQEIAEEESRRIFWVIQTIFGFMIGRSFYTYSSIFIPPYTNDIFTLSIALISVYVCILWSWIDFSFTLIVAPYQFRHKILERFRFVSDLTIVLLYSYLLVYLEYLYKNPNNYLIEFFITFILIYFGYIFSGILRKIQYGKRASRLTLIIIFCLLFLILTIIYYLFDKTFIKNNIIVNRIFLISTIFLTLLYRIIRSQISKRKFTIAVDVDGVLANQIDGILPIIKKEKGIDLSYNDVNNWRLQIKDTSIDKIIIEEQKHKNYILNMPVHNNAKDVVNKLIKKHYIAIATARPTDSDYWTKEWLSKNNISYDSYYNLKEGGKHNANEDFDILIDDYIGNLEIYLEKHEGKAILFNQPWNQDRSNLEIYIKNKRLAIANNWNEIENLVKNMFL